MAYTTINKSSSYFDTKLYTGNGSATQAITGVGFQPDFVWIKDRTTAYDHQLFDVVRGGGNSLYSNDAVVENTYTTDITFDSDGFTVAGPSVIYINKSGDAFASWNWKANGTGVSNTSGTISSTVSANTTSGFSVVGYTGTGANATVGHGLGVAPSMIICKSRTQAQNWAVYHKSLGNTKALFLDGTSVGTSASYWNNTSPTSTVFTIGNSGDVNYNAGTQIAYCFAEVKGFSKFGSYTGNNSTNGTFVYTGFKPAWIMIKTTSAAESWNMGDNKRNITYPPGANVNNAELYANLLNVETDRSTRGGGVTQFDMLSNGFKCRGANPDINYSGYNYIYMAFAENPFVSSTLVPTTAR
jgi:hypothetical protein